MEQKKARFSLSRKLALMVAAIALTLSAVQIFSSYTHYRAEMYEHYEEFAMNIAAVAASQLDPDRIQHYLDTGEKDETYETAYKTLCDIRENGGVMYLYVVKPEIDEVWYVMDTDPSEDAIPLGYHEPYYEGAFAENAERMARGERIEPLVSNEQFGWLMSVYYPMKTSTGAPAGYVGVDIQMDDVMKDLQRFARQMILLMAALTLAVSLILIRITSKTMAEPIKKLSSAADKLVHEQSGEGAETSIFNQLTIRSNDEVGALYESLRQMEHDMNAYIRDLVSVTAEKERIGAELNVATQIQADMLPRIFPAFPERGEFDIYASMIPAKEVGGDFYDFFLIDDDHLGLVMADVSGKGVPAALFMVIAKTLIKNQAQTGEYSPAKVLTKVNEQLCEGNEAELFVTVWLAILEISTGKGMAANAGHEHPTLRRADGKYELVEYRHSPAVATMEGIRFREHEFELHPGDSLFVYTDGVAEATDAKNELYGTERMLAALNEDPDAAPTEVLAAVKRSVDAFVGDAPQFDDITMLCLKYFGPDGAGKESI
ncbi:MAG: HAMP domain-containing protein [Ruminococcaceae bacterium]|jgi:sigma-B regulation protein RsbU (phosphoserine phosphatase)|nr:HAMP domain-containing protein [Oscillospiraceae bacterium]